MESGSEYRMARPSGTARSQCHFRDVTDIPFQLDKAAGFLVNLFSYPLKGITLIDQLMDIVGCSKCQKYFSSVLKSSLRI